MTSNSFNDINSRNWTPKTRDLLEQLERVSNGMKLEFTSMLEEGEYNGQPMKDTSAATINQICQTEMGGLLDIAAGYCNGINNGVRSEAVEHALTDAINEWHASALTVFDHFGIEQDSLQLPVAVNHFWRRKDGKENPIDRVYDVLKFNEKSEWVAQSFKTNEACAEAVAKADMAKALSS